MGDPVNSMSREQGLLDTYFSTLAQFNYDKAKEITDKERDALRTQAGSNWHVMLNVLSQLALAEKSYMFLGFMATKIFLRKDTSLKTAYEILRSELNKTENITKSPTKDSLENLLAEISAQLVYFVNVRLDLIDIYEKLFNIGHARSGCCEDINVQVSTYLKYGQENLSHASLCHLKTSFCCECEILNELLTAELEMQQWSFMPSLCHLYTAHSKLAQWSNLCQSRESRRITFSPSGFLKQSQLPLLYQWIARLKSCLVSKFTFYFHEILSRQTTPPEMKNLCSKFSVDFYQKVISFQKKLDAISVSLIFDARQIKSYQGHGYRLPDNVMESPKGLENFPAIICYPSEKPTGHWPAIIMTMEGRAAELGLPDKVVCFFDKQVSCTYIIAKVDVRMTLAIILNGKRSEKETYILNFIDDLCTQLRFTKIINTLRPGNK